MSDSRTRSGRSAASAPVGIARHGRLKKSSPWPSIAKFIGAALVVVLVSGASISGILVKQIADNVKVNEQATPQDTRAPLPPSVGAIKGGFNILIVGSDQCEEWDGCKGPGDRGSGKLNDVTMLLHVSEDQTNATAVSFPRDLVVPIPSCPREDGSGNNAAMVGQPINVTLSYGGLNCTALTVEALTGLEIQYAGLITFKGVIAMTNAVGGVKVCLANDLDDDYAKIHLKAGTHKLKGKNALGFLRARHAVGDGSDLTRISSQQVYLSSLVRTLKDKGTLTDPSKLYKIATAATKNMQLSKTLGSLDTMASIGLALKNVPLDRVNFVQYPNTTGQGGIYEGKVAPLAAQANELFQYIKDDEPFKLAAETDGRGAVVDPDADKSDDKGDDEPSSSSTADPDEQTDSSDDEDVKTFNGRGQSAATETCSVPR